MATLFSSSHRRKQDDERFNLSAQEYLERYQIQVYVNDAIRSVLDAREERPLDTCLKYFNSVLQGNHVLLREFEFINATPRNRLAFVRLVVECWRNTNPESQIDVDDHYQKVTLLCVDFPSDYHKEVHKYLREASALSIGNPVKPTTFKAVSTLWQIVFVFKEFLDAVKALFQKLSTSAGPLARSEFLSGVRNIIAAHHWQFSCPASSLLEGILASAQNVKDTRVSLAQLVVGMSKCDKLLVVPLATTTPLSQQAAAAAAAQAQLNSCAASTKS